MKAEELRIGNFVLFNSEIREVSHLDEVQICVVIEPHRMNIDCENPIAFQGIPITEQWLSKFGFKEKPVAGCDREYFIVHEEFELSWDNTTGFDLFMDGSNIGLGLYHIKHIHQLQNLYFALTGQEIVIKK